MRKRNEKHVLDRDMLHKYLGAEYLGKTQNVIFSGHGLEKSPRTTPRNHPDSLFMGISTYVYSNPRIEVSSARGRCIKAGPGLVAEYSTRDVYNMFLDFARAGASAAAAISFCERYGVPDIDNSRASSEDDIPSTRLAVFRASSNRLLFFISLTDCLQGQIDLQFLAKHKEDIRRLALYYQARLAHIPHTKPHRILTRLDETIRDNPTVGASLLVELQASFYVGGTQVLVYLEDHGSPRVRLGAISFLSTVYAQAVESFRRGKGIGFCEACGKPFLRTRSNKRHCDDSCSGLSRVRRARGG